VNFNLGSKIGCAIELLSFAKSGGAKFMINLAAGQRAANRAPPIRQVSPRAPLDNDLGYGVQ
jgi:hypothetical protein